jgi:HEPN domain-containing protein
MKKLTAAWVKKAEADHLRAVTMARILRNDHDGVCFHCQQAAEKYLKALLQELGLGVPRTHLLRDMAALLLPHYPRLRTLQRGLKFLTRFAVDIRYPGEDATKRQSAAALRWMQRVRTEARTLLGLPVRAVRRKKPP